MLIFFSNDGFIITQDSLKDSKLGCAKYYKILAITILCFMQFVAYLEASDSLNFTPQRSEYCTIEMAKDLVDQFQNENLSIDEKKKMSEKIAAEPGSYHPVLLFYAGLEFLKAKEYEKAAPLCAGGLFRTEIQIRFSRDQTVGGLVFWMGTSIHESVELESPQEQQRWKKIWENAIKNFEEWDRKTPKNYEHEFDIPDEHQKKRIIERFYRELKNEVTEEDFEETSKDDRLFFDWKNRVFYSTDVQISFTVPKLFIPKLDRFGKVSEDFQLPNQGSLSIDDGWSNTPRSFREKYEKAISSNKEGVLVEKLITSNGIPAFRKRYWEFNSLVNIFYIFKGDYSFKFEAYLKSEDDEPMFVREMQALINSIQFIDYIFFDPEKNVFHSKYLQVSFSVPEGFVPRLDEWGKFNDNFALPNQAELRIDRVWSHRSCSFQEEYEKKVANRKEGEIVEKLTTTTGISAFRKRRLRDWGLLNVFYIFKGNKSFQMNLFSTAEDEQLFLQKMDSLINSIHFLED